MNQWRADKKFKKHKVFVRLYYNIFPTNSRFAILVVVFRMNICLFPTNIVELFNDNFPLIAKTIRNFNFLFHQFVVDWFISNQSSVSCWFKLVEKYYSITDCILVIRIFSKSTCLVFLHHKWNKFITTLTDNFLVWKLP